MTGATTRSSSWSPSCWSPAAGRYYYGKPAGTYSNFPDDSIACARDVGIPSG